MLPAWAIPLWLVPLKGTLIDVLLVLIAGVIGTSLRGKLNKGYEEGVKTALGLTAIPIGVMLFLANVNPVISLISVTLGYVIGYSLGLSAWLMKFGGFLKKSSFKLGIGRSVKENANEFIEGFVLATVVSLIGPLAVMGPLTEGLTGDMSLIMQKWVFDFFATLVFAASFGRGVIFSAVPILLFQGVFAYAANVFSPLFLPAGCTFENTFAVSRDVVVEMCKRGRVLIDEMTGVGGVLIMMMGIKVSGIKDRLEVENFLPAILLALLFRYILFESGIAF